MICDNLTVSEDGQLYFAGQNATALLETYGSPLYVMDENRIRHNLQVYVTAMRDAFGEDAQVLYASKACSFKEIYRLAAAAGAGIDVVSGGEIYTAVAAGFPMEQAYFHGNNKTDDEIAYAIESGVGYFVVDSEEELLAVNTAAQKAGIVQKILLRITPGIDTHTYEKINTGKVDSKFGNAIETGLAQRITALALQQSNIKLCGMHCHIGSQVFDSDTFFRSSEIMLTFMAQMQKTYGDIGNILDLGGGYGVRYTENDPVIDIRANIFEVAKCIKAKCDELSFPFPAVRLEPGRSIVADAGMTLYTVGSVKRIPGYKNYVAVDGGMGDNPRYALYQSSYTVLCANKMHEQDTLTCDVVGKCCESGDILQPQVTLPASITRGDTLAVLTTGAYNYAMASHYNRIPKLPVIMISDSGVRVAVKRETYADIARNDV